MNPNLERLEPYPFARLSKLLGETQAAELPDISLAMGEPRHPAPQFLIDCLSEKALLINDAMAVRSEGRPRVGG